MGGSARFLLLLTTILLASVSAQDGFQCNYLTDIDQDNDGLIELCDLDALDAVRYQLDGTGYRESFDTVKITAGCPQSGCNGYELCDDLDFNVSDDYRNIINKEAWTSGLGWLPIGDRLSFFSARFEGNGHTIANLYINRPSDYVGLFKVTTKPAKISDLVLSQINITGNSYIGSLAGHNAGSVTYIGVEGGRLIGVGNTVGGLFGANAGTILNGDVILERVEGGGHSLGGLVGHNEGHIRYSVADTSVSGVNQVGGLVGLNSRGALTNSRADGTAKGHDYIGGLVGLNHARISASHAEGKVISGGSYSGGLVGANNRSGGVADSRASGAVSGNLYTGGLVGWNRNSEITNSFAQGRIDGDSDVGGLVGWNEGGRISNTYSSGYVGGVHRVGGLVGSNKGIVSDSFANGQVVASGAHAGGLIGWNYAHQTRHADMVRVIHSYWNSEAAGISFSAGGSPRTTEQLKSPTAPGLPGETFERWDVADWEFGTGEQYPILRHSEGSEKGHLLSGQHIMLSGLLVLDGLSLSPAFNPQTFDYRVNLSDDSVTEIRFSPTIANSTQTISILKDEKIGLPSVNNGETAPIILNVAPEPTLITIARHYRIWVIRHFGLEAMISSDRSDYRVSEGRRIALSVSTSEPDQRRVRYRWSQVSPPQPDLLKGLNTRQAELDIDIPDDFVSRDVDRTPVVLQVEVRVGRTIVTRSTTLTVVKTNGGSMRTLAVPTYREGTLAVSDISEADLSMEPDGGVDPNSFSYQWQYKLPSATLWQDIGDAIQMHYQIPTVLSEIDNIGYRVWLDYRDNQGYDHRIVSEPVSVMKVIGDDGFSDIYYLEDLNAIRNQLNGKYKLVRDLDFNSDASYRDPVNKAKWTVADYGNDADTGWLPIGTLAGRFTGIFNGDGHTIFNLQINRDDADYQGLFGALGSAASVRNIGLPNVRIEGRRHIGGLVGVNAGTIVGSYAVGEFSANSLVGGIVGVNHGKIINSYAGSDISMQSSVSSHLGGLVGTNEGIVINSHATVRILERRSDNVGGLIGWNAINARVINSYAGGDVGGDLFVGGLTGINRGSITNSYANGEVSGNSSVAGLVGTNQISAAMITNSYAVGRVQGSGGGLVAINGGSIRASYWNVEIGGVQNGHGSGQSTRQMQLPTASIGIYEEWDDADWDFGNSAQYPILKYAPGPDGDACGVPGLPQCGELISPRLRYGLRSLATADGVALSPEFDTEAQNRSGIYIGSLSSTANVIRLIPTAIEQAAHIRFYIGDDNTAYDGIRSGETSKAISLQPIGMTRIHIEVQGTVTVRYALYIDYQSITDDRIMPINYLEDLDAIRDRPTGSYKLTRDLDFADSESYLDPLNRIFWTVDDYQDATDTGWVPIGNESEPFAGRFDGNGYTISGLQINRDDADNQSLFGVSTSAALISNIGLLNVKVEGGAKVAGLIGTHRGQVGYSYVSGSVVSKSIEGVGGGLVASNDGGEVIGSYAIAEVSGTSSLGGLIGDNNGKIINSHADSIVIPSSAGARFSGLVGLNRSLIANSYATGKVLPGGGSTIIGGLVGWNASKARIINGYAAVSIVGAIAGGLVGYNLGSIKSSYAVGNLVGSGNAIGIGSLVGINDGGTIVVSYWNTDTIAAGSGNGIGQTTAQLQSQNSTMPTNSIYKDWNTDDWDFGNSRQYPILKYTTATEGVFECGSSGLPQCGDLISPGLRYGLRDLTSANDVTFYPPLDIERLNQSGVYSGTVIGEHPSIRLIPVAMESTAHISFMGDRREMVDSHDTSAPISLKNDGIKKVVVEVKGTQTVRYTLYLNYASHRVIDEDGDGLVDIDYLEDLDAIRYQLDGSGYRADDESIKITSGCPSAGCRGYELLRDLDFNDAGSYRNAEKNMGRWTGVGAWQPIGLDEATFTGTFKGNNKTIANLRVRQNSRLARGGLFTTIGSDSRVAHIDGIGLSGVDIKEDVVAGIAASCKRCTISNSYVIGNIEGSTAVAGLINTISATGGGRARISNSYFVGNLAVNGRSAVAGGLVGDVDSDLTITDSYVVGTITAEHDDAFIGGLIGVRTSSAVEISNSYASVSATRADMPQGLFGGNRNPSDQRAPTVHTSYLDKDISQAQVTLGELKRTVALQSQAPTTPTDSIYKNWDTDDWDFGTDEQYPAIRYNLDADFTDGDAHCDVADIQRRPDACHTLLRHQGSLLQDLKLSEGAGLSSPFAFTSFDYGVSVNADRSTIRMLPTAFNAVATIEVFKDGTSIGETDSGEWTVPIPLNDTGDTVFSLVVKDGKRHSYRYQFVINRLDIVAQSIDEDGDGLIEISNATHLNAVRHRLDGGAYQQSETTDAIYCSNGCRGYELTADIDLAGIEWQPIGSLSEPFSGVFNGNGYTISNLTIKMGNTIGMGLFEVIGVRGRVENVGLVNVNIAGQSNVGAIAGYNFGTIINSHAEGKLVVLNSYVGGLVGRNNGGMIVNSYANVDVHANNIYAGGLVGWNETGGFIVNSYAVGTVRANNGLAGGLVGSSPKSAKIHNSYAVGDVRVRTNGNLAGGLIAFGGLIVNSYYKAGAVISRTDSLIGTDKTVMALQSGMPSDDIYTEWDRADWHFGNAEQYPALLYVPGNANDMVCRQPSLEQLSACNGGLFATLSEHDRAVVCRSHLPRLPEQTPYCGALLPEQRAGLVRLEFSKNAHLIPAFNPEIYDYHLVVGSGDEFRTTPTAYYGSDTITVDAGDLNSSTSSGRSSLFTLNDNLDSIMIRVQSATPGMPTRYTIKVLQNIAVVDGLITIDYLEDLDLMRYSLAQVSSTLKDCPIDTEDGVRRCKGYKLARDLDFKNPTSYRTGNLNPIWTTGAGWQPIGNHHNPFSGLFSGNAHTISNLRIHGIPVGDIGLFGVVADDARIENIGLLNVNIDVDNDRHSLFDIGVLVGENHGKIINSYVVGGRVQGDLFVGGLVGRNPRGVIVNSYTRVDVQVGMKTNNRVAGGLVGIHGGRALNENERSPTIRNSYASGTVVGNDYVGGLAGYFGGEIVNSYATGDVSGNIHIGGLIGRLLLDTTKVNNNYAIGKVTGKSLIGGLVGSTANAEIRDAVNASYWDIDTSDTTESVAGIGKMTAELQTPAIGDGIYSNWDNNDWYSESSLQYPVLRYTSATDVVARPACRETGDEGVELPICGNLLPGQGIGLSNLARSNRTGQVLLLRPDFNSGIYDYELILKSDAREFSIIPYTFNPNAVITLNDDSETNPRMELRSGEVTTLTIDNINDLLLTLTVEDPLVSRTTQTTLYSIRVSKHSFVTVNDIDEDDDGLIEVRSADALNAIRYQLDGSGYKASRDDTKITVGCPTTPTLGCKGYELAASIDLSGFDWHPIGVIDATTLDCNDTQSRCFASIFDGNNHTISNLRIDKTATDNVGLFAALADGAQVKNVNLTDVEVGGRFGVGSLATYNAGVIDNSSADGTLAGEHAVGGLVAYNVGRISNSYAYGAVSGGSSVGGLIARNESTGVITNSYSLSRVSGDTGIGGLVALNLGSIANTYASGGVEGVALIGGLIGENSGSVGNSYATADIVCTGVPACTSYTVATGGLIGSNVGGIAVNSYWDIATSNLHESAGGVGKTTVQLQSGTGQSSDASGAYYRWDDSDWHFGDVYHYPILKYTTNTESTLTGLQSYGLTSLTIAEIVTLSPNFDTTKLYYRIGIELDANIKQLHLIPNALDEDATIRIVSDNGFDETIKTGTTSSAIVLRSTDTTVISVEVSGDRRIRYRFEVDYFSSGFEGDVDTDKDGLIDILTLEDLDAIRNALDGRSLRYQNADGVLIESAKGCPMTGCKGYELLQDLDFDNPAHYRAGSVNTAWTTGSGWQPIGTSLHPFTAIFKGNGYTISNLRVNSPDSDYIGLFGVLDGSKSDVLIEGIGLTSVDIVGGAHVGGLVGTNRAGDIRRSYVVGSVMARGNGTSAMVGGLVGRNVAGSITESYAETQVKANLAAGLSVALAGGLVALNDNRSRIENSYAIGSIIGWDTVGGLVALNRGSSKIINSYAVNRVIAVGARPKVGGLVAVNDAKVNDSYWDIEASGVASSAGGSSATTAILRSSTPTTPINSIYRNWDADIWEFADANRYPELKAIADAPLLTPEGKSLLQSLTLSNNVRLFPSFHPLIFDYDLIAEAARMTEVRLNTTSTRAGTTIDTACSDDLVCSSGIPTSFILDGSHTPKITITTDNSDVGVLSYNFSVRYVESDIGRMTATTTTIISLPLAAAEGERIRLITSYDFGLSTDSYRYRWRQSTGDALRFNDELSPVDTQSAVLDFTVPSDVVSKQDDRRVIQLTLEIVVNEDVYLSKVLSLIISKRDNDTADRIRLLKDDDKLHAYTLKFERADGSEFIDRDGGFAETRIQWQRRRSEAEGWINLVSTFAYTIPNEGDYQYRVLAMYEDNQGYRGQFESEVIDYSDIDDDNDGLIEIRYLEDLDAIRYQSDGSGYKATASVDKITTGCPLVNGVEQCRGYELMNDLDFTDDASYRTPSPSLLKNSWTVSDFKDASDSGWQPIDGLNAVFNGNGYTISNIQINRSVGDTNHIGLFSQIGVVGKVKNLGLVDPTIKGLVGIKNVGGIAGRMERGGVIMNSYVVGDVASGNTDKIIRGDVGFGNGRGFIGGLVGWNKGFILNSYAKINVVAEDSETPGNKRVGVGGLVGRNIDGGKVYNSYATGEVKGPCIVGGLVGNQFSTNSDELPKRSEIKNSYATGNVETGFGTCVNSDNKVAGGLVGVNNNSAIENSYTLGEVVGDGTLNGLVAGILPAGDTSIANPINSYWNFDRNCKFITILSFVIGVRCFGIAGNIKNVRIPDNLKRPIAPDTMANSCIESFVNDLEPEDVCKTYVNWNTADWNFGTSSQYPALKYGVGLDTADPGCDTEPETVLPSCDSLLHGQIADALLLDRLSLSVNSKNVHLTPSFMPSRFNYGAMIEVEEAPVIIDIATSAGKNTRITIRKDNGSPLTGQSDGTVQISAEDSFKLKVETLRESNRGASYQIQVRLKYPLKARIMKIVNGSTPTELIARNIFVLDEGDVFRLDASMSIVQKNSQLDYQWTQLSGKSLLSGIRTASTVEFTVPTDFVARDEDDSTVVLKLKLSESNNSASVVSREVPLLVRKVNNGNSASAVKWISSDTLSAEDLSNDIDGGSLTDIGYRWLRERNGRFVAIPGANQKSYIVPRSARNAQYRVSISYIDGQGYRTNIHYDAPQFTTIANFVDKDNDGLIEIETVEDLNAIRYQPDGRGYRASSTTIMMTTGCPLVNGVEKCRGYELVKDLDFLDDASYNSTANKVAWTTGTGWQPIGIVANNNCSDAGSDCFAGIFDGNGYRITNLQINRDTTDEIGLFAGNTGTIRNLRLSAIEVKGNAGVGGLVGRNEGELMSIYVVEGRVEGQNNVIGLLTGVSVSGSSIINSYVSGTVLGSRFVGGICGINHGGIIIGSYAVADVSAERGAGGLVGENRGLIGNSYVAGSVSISEKKRAVGGLVGTLWGRGSVVNSYSTVEVKTTFVATANTDEQYVGGLIGIRQSPGLVVANSYWDTDASGQTNSPGGGTAKTKAELQMPTAPGTMVNDIYYTWDTDDWDFGTADEYPVLKYHDNTCGTSTPSPDCGRLLPHQRIGLRALKLEQNVGAGHLYLSPDFDPAVTTYTVSVHADASELRVTPIAANPDASIIADDRVLPTNDTGYSVSLNTSEPTSTVIRVATSNAAGMEAPVVYKLTINNNRLPRISINAPASIVEGETFALNTAIADPEGDELSYSLSMIPNLLSDIERSTGTVVGRADLRYEHDIPNDLLDEMQNTDVVDIVLTVDDGLGVAGETVRLTIIKKNNGVISVPAPTLNGFRYTIAGIDLSSDSDGTNPTPEIAYRWQKELLGSWLDIDGATDQSHTVEGIIGNRYRVLIDYTDKQGYRHRGLASPAMSAPQQFIYNVVRSRGVVRTSINRSTVIFVNIRVFPEGFLR